MGSTIGDLRHRITFEEASDTPNDSGGRARTWTSVVTTWAKITPKNREERYFAGRVEPLTTHDIVIRRYNGLTTAMRVSFGSRIFQIKSIVYEDERQEFMKIGCVEGTGT